MARRAARPTAVSGANALKRRWRAVITLVLAAMLAPLVWLREPLPTIDTRAILSLRPLPPPRPALGPFAIEGLWQLDSPNSLFGGYSALVSPAPGELFAASDSGAFLRFAAPPADPAPRFGRIAGDATSHKYRVDIEAMTRDSASGTLWFAYEGVNLIERRNAALGEPRGTSPAAFATMGGNSGAEALVRLADGRFIVLAEGARRMLGHHHKGFLFTGDPAQGAIPAQFLFDAPSGFSPVDMAQLPDGRVLVLLRHLVLGLPPRFESAILIADPGAIRPGGVWRGRVLARITDPRIAENYEGLAIVPQAGCKISLWLIADDNNAAFQRVLLMRLGFDPAAIRAAPAVVRPQ